MKINDILFSIGCQKNNYYYLPRCKVQIHKLCKAYNFVEEILILVLFRERCGVAFDNISRLSQINSFSREKLYCNAKSQPSQKTLDNIKHWFLLSRQLVSSVRHDDKFDRNKKGKCSRQYFDLMLLMNSFWWSTHFSFTDSMVNMTCHIIFEIDRERIVALIEEDYS